MHPGGVANSAQHAFQFDQAIPGGNPSWFHNTFARLTVLNAYTGWALVTPAGTTGSVWDTHFSDIVLDNIQRSGWWLYPAVAQGQPISTWRDISVNNANGPVVATAPIFDFGAVEAHLSGLDLEGWVNTILSCGGGYNTDVEGFHIEHHMFDGVTTNYSLFNLGGGYLKIRNGSVAGSSLGGAYGTRRW